MIRLWRNKPLKKKGRPGGKSLPDQCVFPSARQALSAALELTGLGRADRIALPEWSSHCVISAAGKIATPLPLLDVLAHDVPVSAVLIYEQWGWPFSDAVHRQIRAKFRNAVIVLDCVDSADIEQVNRIDNYQEAENKVIVVYSLSKLLGLKGGGVARTASGYLDFFPKASAKTLHRLMWQSEAVNDIGQELLHIHKTNIQYVHYDVRNWLNMNDISSCLFAEANRRRENLKIIAVSSMAECWPQWMHDAVAAGAAPGIVPLGYKRTSQTLQDFGQYLLTKYNIETSIYNFNWSGNPLAVDYSSCLAFPIHGEIEKQLLQDIVDDKPGI